MGIVAVQQPRITKRDPLDTIAQGLKIAQGIYGIKTAFEQSDLRKLQMQREQQQIEAGEMGLAEKERKLFLEEEGIIPKIDFNKEYYKVNDKQIEEFQKKYSDYPLIPVQVNVENQDAEEGFIPVMAISKDDVKEAKKAALELKKLQAKTEKETTPKPPGQTEFKKAGFGSRMVSANKILKDLENSGFSRASAGTSITASFTGLLGGLGEYFKPEDLKLYEQAKQNFILAQLRDESGAAIGTDEYKQAEKIYFPQPGDSEKVIMSKRFAREMAADNMLKGSGSVLQQPQMTPMNQGGGIIPQKTFTPTIPQESVPEFLQRYMMEND